MKSRLFITQSPDKLIGESEIPERRLKRTLTAFDLTMLGIGAVIGAGWSIVKNAKV